MPYFQVTKTGRLKMPSYKKLEVVDTSGTSIDWKGDPVAKIGDYVHTGMGVSAGTVGRLVEVDDFGDLSGLNISSGQPHWLSGTVETLDGDVNTGWLWAMTVIPYTAVQEVKDFYINDGRPGRIKVSW